eukprot:5264115-Prymnesium_polylepis.3
MSPTLLEFYAPLNIGRRSAKYGFMRFYPMRIFRYGFMRIYAQRRPAGGADRPLNGPRRRPAGGADRPLNGCGRPRRSRP